MSLQRQLFTKCSREDVAPTVLITSLEEVYTYAVSLLKDTRPEVRGRGGFQARTGKYHGIRVTILKTPIGAPATAIALEEFYRLGARVFVKVDTALSLQRRLPPGTLILPIAAVRAESVSKYFAPPEYPAIPSYRFLQVLGKVAISSKKISEPVPTVVMSTDMFYVTDRAEYEKWARLVGAVDMDTATLYTIARVKGIEAGALLVIDSAVWAEARREEIWLETLTETEETHKTREEVMNVLKTAVKLGLETLLAMYEYMKAEKLQEEIERRGKINRTEAVKTTSLV